MLHSPRPKTTHPPIRREEACVIKRFSQESAASGPSVSGHANLHYGPEYFQTAEFHARILPNGKADGTLELRVNGQDSGYGNVHGDVTCLVVHGNEAILGGTARSSIEGNPIVAFWVRVRDNGEGADAPPDQWSDVVVWSAGQRVPPDLCALTFPRIPLQPVEDGNFQVRP